MVHLIICLMKLVRDFFMFYFAIPVADLGFTLGTFLVFAFILKMALGMFMNLGLPHTATKVRAIVPASVGKKIAKQQQKRGSK